MTIQTVSTQKRGNDKWIVVIQDTLDVIGKNEKGLDIYNKYQVTYYPSKGTNDLKKRIEDKIRAKKRIVEDAGKTKTQIKTTVESIDVSTLE